MNITTRDEKQTDLLLKRLLSLDVVLFEFIIELLESFQVFNRDTHLLNLLTEHEISFSELHEHLFRAERVVQLGFEVVDLGLGVGEFDES